MCCPRVSDKWGHSGPSRTPRQIQEGFLEEVALDCRVLCVNVL